MQKKIWIGIAATSLVLCLLVAGLHGATTANEHGERTKTLWEWEQNFPCGVTERVNLSIHVMEGKNSTPIAGASITGKRLGDMYYNGTIENETWYFYGETDKNGNFAVQVVPDTYYIYVYAESYMPKSLSLTIGDVNGSFYVEIVLDPIPSPDSIVKGRVLNQSDGSQIENATVYAWSQIGSNEGVYYPFETMALTDGDGNYELKVHSGILVLHAYAEGHYDYSTTVNVPPNTTMQLDISLIPLKEPEIVSRIQGRVLSADGFVAGAKLEFVYYCGWNLRIDEYGGIGSTSISSEIPGYNGSYPGTWCYSGVTDSKGNYAVDVPAGWLTLTVFAEGFYPRYKEVFVDAGAVLWLNITLEELPEPDAWITGTVHNEQGINVKGAYVSAYALQETVNILPSNGAATTNATYGYYTTSAETDENGKFTLAVPAGQYVLYAFHATYGGYNGVVEVEQGTTVTIEITLTTVTNNTVLPGNETEGSYVISLPKDIAVVPKFTGTRELTLSPGSELRISVSTLFTVPQGKRIMFGVRETTYISAVYNSATGELLLKAPENWQGEEVITVEATDGITTVIGTILVKIHGNFPVNIALWFACGILVAAGVIAVIWYWQRNGKRIQKF